MSQRTGLWPARLHHLRYDSKQPEAMVTFYRDCLGLEPRELGDGLWLMAGGERRLLIGGGETELAFSAFALENTGRLDDFRAQVQAQGLNLAPSPTPLFAEDAFTVHDPDGRGVVFGVPAEPPEAPRRMDRLAGRLQHVVVATTQVVSMTAFYEDALGFVVSDRVCDDSGEVTRVLPALRPRAPQLRLVPRPRGTPRPPRLRGPGLERYPRLGGPLRGPGGAHILGTGAPWAGQQPVHHGRGPGRQQGGDVGRTRAHAPPHAATRMGARGTHAQSLGRRVDAQLGAERRIAAPFAVAAAPNRRAAGQKWWMNTEDRWCNLAQEPTSVDEALTPRSKPFGDTWEQPSDEPARKATANESVEAHAAGTGSVIRPSVGKPGGVQ